MSHSYTDLLVWQKSVALVTEIYRTTKKFPADELYGLAAQLRQAAVSVPSNIAEGQGRSTPKEFRQFLAVARGSMAEVETQLLIARNLGYLGDSEAGKLRKDCAEVARMLHGLMEAVSTQQK